MYTVVRAPYTVSLSTESEPCDGACRASASVDAFFDVEHPDVFVHVRNESVVLSQSMPASDVMLFSQSPVLSAQAGYSSLVSLYAGTGYWSRQTNMPAPLTDHKVCAMSSRVHPVGVMGFTQSYEL